MPFSRVRELKGKNKFYQMWERDDFTFRFINFEVLVSHLKWYNQKAARDSSLDFESSLSINSREESSLFTCNQVPLSGFFPFLPSKLVPCKFVERRYMSVQWMVIEALEGYVLILGKYWLKKIKEQKSKGVWGTILMTRWGKTWVRIEDRLCM